VVCANHLTIGTVSLKVSGTLVRLEMFRFVMKKVLVKRSGAWAEVGMELLRIKVGVARVGDKLAWGLAEVFKVGLELLRVEAGVARVGDKLAWGWAEVFKVGLELLRVEAEVVRVGDKLLWGWVEMFKVGMKVFMVNKMLWVVRVGMERLRVEMEVIKVHEVRAEIMDRRAVVKWELEGLMIGVIEEFMIGQEVFRIKMVELVVKLEVINARLEGLVVRLVELRMWVMLEGFVFMPIIAIMASRLG